MLCSFVTSIMVPLCPWNNSLEGAYLKFSLSEFEVLSLHSYSNSLNKFNTECGLPPCLPFLCVVWRLHKNPMKTKIINIASSPFLTRF
jgi:hypothetical protein